MMYRRALWGIVVMASVGLFACSSDSQEEQNQSSGKDVVEKDLESDLSGKEVAGEIDAPQNDSLTEGEEDTSDANTKDTLQDSNNGEVLTYDEAGWKRVVPKDGQKWIYHWHDQDVPVVFHAKAQYKDKEVSLIEVGDFSKTPITGMKAWMDLSTPWVWKLYAVDFYENSESIDKPYMTHVFDPPMVLKLGLEEGETAKSYYKTSLYFDGEEDPTEEAVDEVQTLTLIQKDATVTVPYGTVTGCFHYKAGLYYGTSNPDFSKEPDIISEFWYHPDIGPVKAIGENGYELVKVVQ